MSSFSMSVWEFFLEASTLTAPVDILLSKIKNFQGNDLLDAKSIVAVTLLARREYEAAKLLLDEVNREIEEMEIENNQLRIAFNMSNNLQYYWRRYHSHREGRNRTRQMKDQFHNYLDHQFINITDPLDLAYAKWMYHEIEVMFLDTYGNDILTGQNSGKTQDQLAQAYSIPAAKDFHSHAKTTENDIVKQYGKYIEWIATSFIPEVHLFNGRFEQAETMFKEFVTVGTENHWYMFEWFGEVYLTYMYRLYGKLDEALKHNQRAMEISLQIDSFRWIAHRLWERMNIYAEMGNFDQALENAYKAYEIFKAKGTIVETHEGLIRIFRVYFQWDEHERSLQTYEHMKQIYQQIVKLVQENTDKIDPESIVNERTQFCEALLYKGGNMKQKVMAMDILNELSENNPTDDEVRFHLIDLLYKDLSIENTIDTVLQLEKHMLHIKNNSSYANKSAITFYAMKQITLAKYEFVVNDDISSALDILRNTLDIVIPLKIDKTLYQLQNEIYKLERFVNQSLSQKERLEQSQLDNYFKVATKVADEFQ